MKTLHSYNSSELQLVQPSIWKRAYDLRTSDEVIMSMTYPKIFSTNAVVTGFGQTWEISKPSIWKSNLEIKKQGNQLPFAKFTAESWGKGGLFELPNGERINYAFGVWKGTNEIFGANKIRLVSLKRTSIWKTAITVSYEQQSNLIEEHPWIIMAVYYIMLERRSHASGSAV